jgi:hypothetical protein
MASFMNFRLLFAWVVNFCLLSPGALSASGDGARRKINPEIDSLLDWELT